MLVFNEIDGLKEVFDDIPTREFDVTVAVDGGSTDGSRNLQERGIPHLDQPICRGVAFRVAAEALNVNVYILLSRWK